MTNALRTFLTSASLLVALVAVWILLSCRPEDNDVVPLEDEIEDSGLEDSGDVELVESQAEPAPPTWQDVLQALEEELPTSEWSDYPTVPEATKYDLARRLLYRSVAWERDPIFLAEELSDLVRVIVTMQPGFASGSHGGMTRALNLSIDIFVAVGNATPSSCSDSGGEEVPELNPYIIASMSYRESSLSLDTERGYQLKRVGNVLVKNYDCRWCTGSRGERGMFQFMPSKSGGPGFVESMMPQSCNDPFDRWCSIQSVVGYLSQLRCACITQFGDECTLHAIVASYGRDTRHLVSPMDARHHRGPANARLYLCRADADCDEHWPVDFQDGLP